MARHDVGYRTVCMGKRSLVRKAILKIMFERHDAPPSDLPPMEAQILKFIKSKSRTEKRISKALQIDPLVLSPVVTDLILKGYLEIVRRRWLYFFTHEMCTITVEGISALDKARSPIQMVVDFVQKKALETLDSMMAESPALKVAAMSARTLYKIAKVIA